MNALLPFEESDTRPVENKAHILGKTYNFQITMYNGRTGEIVLSRKVLLVKELLESLEVDQVVEGVITYITGCYAYIDIGGIDAELYRYSPENVSSFESLQVGEKLKVRISKVSLGSESVDVVLDSER